MQTKQFIPFLDIHQYQGVLVVDSFHPRGLVLSHWRGAPKLPQLHDDTSAGIVLNALKADLPELHTHAYVTNNHFDIDGFLGVWSLLYPQKALQHEQLIRKMALMGDFREMDLQTEEDHLALKLVCWINRAESGRFYAPFASYAPRQSEVKLCVPKYTFFLEAFGAVLEDPERYRAEWQQEYEQVVADWAVMRGPKSGLTLERSIRLLVVETPEPLHYYALFGQSAPADMVLSLYSGNRYELEYKYTSWVDTAHRPGFPRLDLQPLAGQLNALEEGPHRWAADKITDTGPILRLQGTPLSKEERFDHPYKRPIYASSIPSRSFKAVVQQYFEQGYRNQPQKPHWSWAQLRALNEALFSKKEIPL
ncbi:DUF6687 family protein [Cesiribacter andamanensis]|uniref:Uncharacterized protein n=1 Tax=Cesiribacter andamanensis AMV16 TaxID=1279009 RepID=M7MXA7_9BACT|nr:DUF6687 family protein [Cesiribacter andamanensis]EMR01068.1 hypothetical protein ADICEAN_03816 [Cesiribacter andamanensis AMV16]